MLLERDIWGMCHRNNDHSETVCLSIWEDIWGVFSYDSTLCLTALTQGVLLNPKLTTAARIDRQPESCCDLCLHLPMLGLQAHTVLPGFLCGCQGFELMSQCLDSKPSYLPSHLTSTIDILKVLNIANYTNPSSSRNYKLPVFPQTNFHKLLI